MTFRSLVAFAIAALLSAGCSGSFDEAATVSTLEPLQQLDVQTVPPQTVPTTVPPTNPVVQETTPGGGTAATGDGAGTNGATETTEPGQGCTYTVVQGDNPTKIANKTGITVEAFTEANKDSGVLNSLLIGSKVVIPPPGRC